ncbi:MAG: PHP domain-containing protein, partial [Proteobacteria bacterium]|nr:PHP domain-containing protein [Pseudomonadota bacterium]
MKRFRADLHIHSCLSPCAELDMSPRAIVEKSLEMGVEIIALCDHNSAENVGAAMRAGAQRGLLVLPGMEINSMEEVHTLAIFETEKQALNMQEMIYRHLRGTNRPELFGDQVVANEFDEVEGFNDRRLIGATELRLQQIVREVHRLGGLCIASHVDRPAFS